MKEVCTDVNFAVGDFRGMGRYLNQFLKNLEEYYSEVNITRLLRSGIAAESTMSFGNKNYVVWEQYSLPRFIKKHKPDVVIFPYNTAPLFLRTRAKRILILHDLIFLRSYGEIGPSVSLIQNIGRIYRRLVVPHAIHAADVIVTVSAYTKNEILEKYPEINKRIYVIPNSIDMDKWSRKPVLLRKKRDPFIFHVGGDAPQKNSESVIMAYAKLDSSLKDKYRLKILGLKSLKMIGKLLKSIDDLGLSGKVDVLPFVDHRKLKELYREAALFLFPSFYEGFGIPLIEAMASGCPVVCSNTSCLPEIAGEAAVYFNPNDTGEEANAISKVLASKELRDSLIQKGYVQVMRYSSRYVHGLINDFIEKEIFY